MPGSKKLWEEHLFPSEKIVFLPSVEKTTIFSSGNKSSPQSFSVPGIMFPARRNIYSSRLHKFCINWFPNTKESWHVNYYSRFFCKTNDSNHRLWTPNESFLSSKSQTFELGQTNWADEFWGIWGIFGWFISTHFGTASPFFHVFY